MAEPALNVPAVGAPPVAPGGTPTVAAGVDMSSAPRPLLCIIGLDLSLRATGVASRSWVDTLIPPKHMNGYPRLAWLRQSIRDLVGEGTVDLVVVEGLAYAAHDTGRQSAGLWWLITFDLWRREVPTAIVPPAVRAKYATGKGNAPKDAVLAAAIRRFPHVDVANNNEADALILAAAGYDHAGQPIADMPAAHRAALDSVEWPVLAGAAL